MVVSTGSVTAEIEEVARVKMRVRSRGSIVGRSSDSGARWRFEKSGARDYVRGSRGGTGLYEDRDQVFEMEEGGKRAAALWRCGGSVPRGEGELAILV